MEMILKATGIVTISVVLTVTLRRDQPTISLLLSLVAMIVLFEIAGDALTAVVSVGQDMAKLSSLSGKQLSVLLKVLAITVLTKFTVDFCKDAGCAGIAGIAEMTGNLLAIFTATPLLQELLQFISSI